MRQEMRGLTWDNGRFVAKLRQKPLQAGRAQSAGHASSQVSGGGGGI
jgi:hypothetical protein